MHNSTSSIARSVGIIKKLIYLARTKHEAASLKALWIVPRSPSPVPLEDRPAAELSEAELRELVGIQKVCLPTSRSGTCKSLTPLQKRLAASEALKREVKRERSGSVSSSRPTKIARTSGGPVEMIDLTDD